MSQSQLLTQGPQFTPQSRKIDIQPNELPAHILSTKHRRREQNRSCVIGEAAGAVRHTLMDKRLIFLLREADRYGTSLAFEQRSLPLPSCRRLPAGNAIELRVDEYLGPIGCAQLLSISTATERCSKVTDTTKWWCFFTSTSVPSTPVNAP
jgi:hypothetical protein